MAVPIPIRDVLERRGDLSSFLVHLTRDTNAVAAAANLRSIAETLRLEARSPMGWARDQDDPSDPQAQTQRVVCFTETPLQHIYSMVADIEGRSVRLKPYGLLVTKYAARGRGVNPVWYVDMTPGHDFVIAGAVDHLKQEAVDSGGFHNSPAAQILPFFEQMGTWPNSQKEFWWEREWRHVGDFWFWLQQVIWICPEGEQLEFRKFVSDSHNYALQEIRCIDASWGVESIVAKLAWFGPTSPFSAR